MRAQFINEKFKEDSDPIRDLKIGIKMPSDFTPMFILKRQYPGMEWPERSIFGKRTGWSCLWVLDKDGKPHGNTVWDISYFKPWIGEFFEEL